MKHARTLTGNGASTYADATLHAIDHFLNAPDCLLFSSQDLDEVRSMVGRVMKPHELRLCRQSDRLSARMHHRTLGNLSISRLRYGTHVQITPGPLESFYLIQMPIAGGALIRSGNCQIESDTSLASVLSPDDDTHMQWHQGNDQLLLRLSRSLVERTLIGHLGHPLEEPLRFELGFRWQQSAAWCSTLSYILACAAHHPNLHPDQHKLLLSQLEQLCASVLLTSHAHNYADSRPPRRCKVLPRHIRRAQDFIEAHAHEAITVEQLATVAGVSARSLYAGFRDFLQVTPMNYLRDLRMARARTELLSGEASSVASVALRWGFAHMGRFGNDYKKRYGETPGQTLRRH
ncbi:MAG: AraC family transcriptional regulator [Lautropia sp.]|nr:AraC family transcriptional regulator [Lautropia sp.]